MRLYKGDRRLCALAQPCNNKINNITKNYDFLITFRMGLTRMGL